MRLLSAFALTFIGLSSVEHTVSLSNQMKKCKYRHWNNCKTEIIVRLLVILIQCYPELSEKLDLGKIVFLNPTFRTMLQCMCVVQCTWLYLFSKRFLITSWIFEQCSFFFLSYLFYDQYETIWWVFFIHCLNKALNINLIHVPEFCHMLRATITYAIILHVAALY